ncbi:hypothetical protein J6590_098568 [Homalodisca vitripennis]|nr:hypothetical protein J6590_098568 [Homalodisca vitripennis]
MGTDEKHPYFYSSDRQPGRLAKDLETNARNLNYINRLHYLVQHLMDENHTINGSSIEMSVFLSSVDRDVPSYCKESILLYVQTQNDKIKKMASLLKRARQCSRRVVYPWKFNLHGKPIDLNFRPYATVKYKTNSDSKKTKCRIFCCPLRPYALDSGSTFPAWDSLSTPSEAGKKLPRQFYDVDLQSVYATHLG